MYTGKEGTPVTQAEFDSLVRSYQDLHGEEDSYVKFDSISFDSLRLAMVKEAVAFRVYNGYDGDRTRKLFVPVDKNGKEISILIFGKEDDKEAAVEKKAMRDDPPACPPLCG